MTKAFEAQSEDEQEEDEEAGFVVATCEAGDERFRKPKPKHKSEPNRQLTSSST